jgi:hypothetical protein
VLALEMDEGDMPVISIIVYDGWPSRERGWSLQARIDS